MSQPPADPKAPRPLVYSPPVAADVILSNPRTLERWRTRGEGPAFVKIGRRVGYTPVALAEWVQQQTRRHTRQP